MRINILGHMYSIERIDETNMPDDLIDKFEDNMGLCENYSHELLILGNKYDNHNYRKINLLEQKVGRHEMFHAYFFKSGISQLIDKKTEEAIVDFLAINLENMYGNASQINKYIKGSD